MDPQKDLIEVGSCEHIDRNGRCTLHFINQTRRECIRCKHGWLARLTMPSESCQIILKQA